MKSDAVTEDYVVPRGTFLRSGLRRRIDVAPASGLRALREANAKIHRQYRLANGAGELLHGSVSVAGALQFVTVKAHAWQGDATKLARLRETFPETRTLSVVPVPKDTGRHDLHLSIRRL